MILNIKIIYIDETTFSLNFHKNFGYSKKGTTVNVRVK